MELVNYSTFLMTVGCTILEKFALHCSVIHSYSEDVRHVYYE